MELALLFSALGLGFLSGFHCIGMCGPIALSLGLSKQQALRFHLQNTTYNLGRIFTYSLLGAILGVVGEGFQLAGFQQYLSAISGILLIIIALFSFGSIDFSSKIPFLTPFLLKVKINLGKILQKQGYTHRFATGILNGFLPCGVVYMALTASLAAGGIWQGAVYMTFFGIGTFPFMYAVVAFGSVVGTTFRNRILRMMPYILILIGTLFIIRSLELGIPYLSPQKAALEINKIPIQQQKDNCH